MTVLASVDGQIQTLVQLAAKVIERGWTRAVVEVRLKKAHGVGSWLVLWDVK